MQIPKIQQFQQNFCSVELPNGVIYISYKTPVALEVYGDYHIQRVRRKKFYSVTTSRHLNRHCQGYRMVDEDEWAHLLAQVLGEEAPAAEETPDEKFRRFIQI